MSSLLVLRNLARFALFWDLRVDAHWSVTYIRRVCGDDWSRSLERWSTRIFGQVPGRVVATTDYTTVATTLPRVLCAGLLAP